MTSSFTKESYEGAGWVGKLGVRRLRGVSGVGATIMDVGLAPLDIPTY